ncbi:glycosyltransferase [Beijerinckia sp. L45]|uniref:glycosyltransferase n=1 Tax=Beijerinckia sp. L45 TaxID=1641855 RepID=UPI001FED8221|nr:glycosyltransferase [Beijerinckia sp. L45]
MPEAFHYAPVDVAGIRRRMSLLAAWIDTNDPALIVTDVSVEIALFARLMGVRTAVMRLAGARTDVPHLEAFRSAASILTPFPSAFESSETPQWVRDKTFYGGFLAPPAVTAAPSTEARRVVVVLGSGGTRISSAALASAANATPRMDWHVYGPALPAVPAPNLTFHGWRPDIANAIDEADVVVGGAGDGLLAEVATRGKRFICFPEDRPFDEQVDKARTLARLGLAVVLEGWPDPEGWVDVFRKVGSLNTERLRALADPHAVAAFAAKIESVAAGA